MRTRKMNSAPATRIFNFHARFTPEGPDDSETDVFLRFFFAALDRTQKRKEKQLAIRKKQFAKLMTARRKTWPVIRKVLHNEISPQAGAEKFKRLVPDKKLLREIFEGWEKATKTTPEQAAKEKEDIARQEVELAKDTKLLKAQESFYKILKMLSEAIEEGSAESAEALADVAFQATCFLQIGEKKKPELFRQIARKTRCWAVMASDEAGWEKEAVQRVGVLELGADLESLKVRFRKARGADANLPARLWAKAAVRTIEQTQFRILSFGQVLRDFGSHQALADFCLENGWKIGKQPEWVHDASGLKKFSSESLPSWKLVVRKLIREQMPGFHTRPEWKTQYNTAVANGRATPGEIQNAILDDITSALSRLVPDSIMPKSTC